MADPRIVFSQNPKNLGRVANYRHLLYDVASSAWYINLDGDDYFTDPLFVNHAMKLIHATDPAEIVFYQGNHDIRKLKRVLPRYTELNEQEILVEGKDFFTYRADP